MYIVKGFRHNTGVIKGTGKAWENYTLMCLKDTKADNLTGYEVQAVKVPVAALQNAFPNSASIIDSKIKINYEVRTFAGKEQAVVESIDIIK